MTDEGFLVFSELADAYRIMREAYRHDMGREAPPKNALQARVAELFARSHESEMAEARRALDAEPTIAETMTGEEFLVFSELADAYRIMREAYHHDMGREAPPKNALQARVAELFARRHGSEITETRLALDAASTVVKAEADAETGQGPEAEAEAADASEAEAEAEPIVMAEAAAAQAETPPDEPTRNSAQTAEIATAAIGKSSPQDRNKGLMDALEAGDLGEARRMLKLGASPDSGNGGRMAIHVCPDSFLKELLAAKASPNSRNASGVTRLMMESERGNFENVALLLAAGADPNVADRNGRCSLHYAAISPAQDPRIAKALLDAGANPRAKDMKTNDALHYANGTGFSELVKMLVEAIMALLKGICGAATAAMPGSANTQTAKPAVQQSAKAVADSQAEAGIAR